MTQWLKTIGITAAAVVIAALLATGIVSISVGGQGAGAQEGDAAASALDAPRVLPSLVGVAIGQLEEADGEEATVDLRATIRDGKPGGALRFYSEEYGYYNGGVRSFTVEDGVIHVSGAGGLTQPDGTRVAVRYDATFASDGTSSIHVRGRDLDYTMEGTLDGLVHVWEPPATSN